MELGDEQDAGQAEVDRGSLQRQHETVRRGVGIYEQITYYGQAQ